MTTDCDIPNSDAHSRWHTSSYSGGQGNCVTVALGSQVLVPVRDSKRPEAPAIRFNREAWAAFLDILR